MFRRSKMRISRAVCLEPLERRIQLAAVGFNASTALSSPSPNQVISADLRNDERNDLIVPDPGHNQLNIFLSNGDGTFAPVIHVATEGGADFVAAADVNGDGKMDLITSNNFDNTVNIFIGNGNGTFKAEKTYAVANAPYYLVTGDFNGDGTPDIAVANANGVISVLLSNANHTFKPFVSIPGALNAGDLITADVNGDHHLDLIESDDGHDTVDVFLGNGDGTFKSAVSTATGNYPKGIAISDVNGDGQPDLIVANQNYHNVSVDLGTGGGHFVNAYTLGTGNAPVAVATADLNGDGTNDIIVTDQNDNDFTIFTSVSAGVVNFYSPLEFKLPDGSGPVSIAAADFNGDGVADIAIADATGNSISVFLNTYTPVKRIATFGSPTNTDIHPFFYSRSVASGDFNRDGIPDLVTANIGSIDVTVLLGKGNGTFQTPIQVNAGNFTYSVAVADFNGDGNADIIATSPTESAAIILYGNGDGTFKAPVTIHLNNVPQQVVVADLNNDGQPDAVFGSDDGSITALINIGFDDQKAIVSHAGGNAVGLAVADLDENGDPDIIATDPSSDSIHILLGNGDGHFTNPITYSSYGVDPMSVAAGDFNHDNNPDVVVANNGDGSVTVFYGEAFGGFTSHTTLLVGNDPESVVVADMNGDNSPDIITANKADGTVSILRSNRNGTFLPVQNCAAGSSPIVVVPVDLNGDGKPDLAVVNYVQSGVSTLINTGGAVYTPVAFTSNSSATFQVGTAGSFTITTSGVPAAGVEESGVLPAGLTFTENNNGTATISGTPTASGGEFITLLAGNGVSSNAMQIFTLVVDAAPAITSAASTTFTEGTNGTFTITATGFPNPALALQASSSLPSGITLHDNGDGTATLSGFPAATGSFMFAVVAASSAKPNFKQIFTLNVNAPPSFTSNAIVGAVESTPLNFIVTTNGSPIPTLASFGTVPPGLTLSLRKDGTARLFGIPTADGLYPIMLSANNGVGSIATEMLTVTVGQASAISSANHTTFSIGTAGSFTINTTGFPTANISATSTLPAGVTLVDNHNGTATLSGTPTVSGSFDITIAASNAILPAASQDFTLVIQGRPVITSDSSFTGQIHQTVNFPINSVSSPAASLVEVGTLPPGLVFTAAVNGTAAITGTPTGRGVYTIQIIAANSFGKARENVTLTITQPPAITSSNTATFAIGTAGAFTVTTSSFPNALVSVSPALPAGLTLTNNLDGTATISGIPTVSGFFDVTLTARNKVLPAGTQALTVAVKGPPAFLSAATATATDGTAISFQISTVGPPNPTVTLTSALPPGLKFQALAAGTAQITGTPISFGKFNVNLLATSNLGSTAQTIVFTINSAPIFLGSSSRTFTFGTASTSTIKTNGFPTPAAIKANTALPSGFTLHDNGDGTATLSDDGTAAAGTTSLVFEARNATGTSNQTFTLNVIRPAFFTSVAGENIDASVSSTFTVIAHGFPRPAIGISGTLPDGIGFKDNGDGTATLSGISPGKTNGAFPVTFTATNGVGSPATQAFTLTVFRAPAFALGANNGDAVVGYADGTASLNFNPFPNQTPAVPRVALADLNGDGIPDLIVGAGPGQKPNVKVFDGVTGNQIASFQPLPNTFLGGLFVAAGDINNDGTPDIIVGTGAGVGPGVLIYSGRTFNLIATVFNPYPSTYTGGVAVAAADFNHDGDADIVTAQAGSGVAPNVKIFDGAQILQGTQTLLASFIPFDTSYTGGALVATGNINGGSTQDVAVSPATGSGSIAVYNFSDSTTRLIPFAPSNAADQTYVISTVDVNEDGFADIVAASNTDGFNLAFILSGKDSTLLFTSLSYDNLV